MTNLCFLYFIFLKALESSDSWYFKIYVYLKKLLNVPKFHISHLHNGRLTPPLFISWSNVRLRWECKIYRVLCRHNTSRSTSQKIQLQFIGLDLSHKYILKKSLIGLGSNSLKGKESGDWQHRQHF